MATTIALKLMNRTAKQPVHNLPASLDLPADATLELVKQQVAAHAGIRDFNRIGLFDPATGKTLKNGKAVVAREPVFTADSPTVLVKDLGPQIGWRTVFFLEYLGPLVLHAAVVALRTRLYGPAPMTPSQWLTLAMFLAHFVKREAETVWVHRFSAATMPARNLAKNCAHYWLLAGLLCAASVYAPVAKTPASFPLVDVAGLALFVFAEAANARVHLALAALRSPGGAERGIPCCIGSSLVTCPNYLFEVLAWVGVLLVSRSWAVAVFLLVGAGQMYVWAGGKEAAYRREFGAKYKKKRYVMLPGLL